MPLYRAVVVFVVAFTAIVVQDGVATESTVSTCTADFAGQDPKSTMCFEDHDNISEEGVSDADKEAIVNYHNQVRREAIPVATDLTALVWDENLATVAQKWAKQCTIKHDRNRRYPAYGKSIGQNIAAGQPNWARAMHTWFSESELYKYGEDPKVYIGRGGWAQIAHYTLMVSNRTQRVGCGFARCDDVPLRRFYVCNYAMGQTSFRYPYTKGETRCSHCPGHCQNGLCDCGGKFCMNRGRLDIKTCTCSCQRIYKGPECKTLDCPSHDRWNCPSRPVSDCTKYSNIPFACPYKCGICPPS